MLNETSKYRKKWLNGKWDEEMLEKRCSNERTEEIQENMWNGRRDEEMATGTLYRLQKCWLVTAEHGDGRVLGNYQGGNNDMKCWMVIVSGKYRSAEGETGTRGTMNEGKDKESAWLISAGRQGCWSACRSEGKQIGYIVMEWLLT